MLKIIFEHREKVVHGKSGSYKKVFQKKKKKEGISKAKIDWY